MIQIMIVDDHVVVREGLKQILELEPDIRVAELAANGQECLDIMATGQRPDVIFMDVQMPGMNGIEITRRLTAQYPGVRVVMLSVYDDEQYVGQAIKAGARGYVLKDAQRAELINVVRSVCRDEAVLDPALTAKMFSSLARHALPGGGVDVEALTRREVEVLRCIAEGLSDKEIAQRLHISEHTSRTHSRNIYRKLEVNTRAQAVALAYKLKL